MKILFIGDVVGKYGLNYLKSKMPYLKQEYKPNLIIVNAENTTNGKGLNLRDYKELMSLNIAALTMGNHTYRNQEINDFIENSKIPSKQLLKKETYYDHIGDRLKELKTISKELAEIKKKK